ncbi:hypothetical protein SPONL_2058 [uncultured Candidatus Thioglobus sp.]|nr:hypothetical protein SPONL_2058 [uncultured Candidatus Thioglobus sp.]
MLIVWQATGKVRLAEIFVTVMDASSDIFVGAPYGTRCKTSVSG